MLEGVEGLQTRALGRFRLAGKTLEVEVVELLGVAANCGEDDKRRCARFEAALADRLAARRHQHRLYNQGVGPKWPLNSTPIAYIYSSSDPKVPNGNHDALLNVMTNGVDGDNKPRADKYCNDALLDIDPRKALCLVLLRQAFAVAARIGFLIYGAMIAMPIVIFSDKKLVHEEKQRISVIFILAFFVIFFWAGWWGWL